MMKKVMLVSALVTVTLTLSLNAMDYPNIIEPMCKEGEFRVFQKSTKTFRSYHGKLCKIAVIAKWVLTNCKDDDELFRTSDCKINAQYAVRNMTPQQNAFPSETLNIQDPQDVSDLMELARIHGALTTNEKNIWKTYKNFFPNPSPKPFLHHK